MSQGPPARPPRGPQLAPPGAPSSPPQAPVAWSVTSDPHGWELMGGGGRAAQTLRSMADRLKVRAGRDSGWLSCAIVATSRQSWNLRHREDTIHLARSSLPVPPSSLPCRLVLGQ